VAISIMDIFEIPASRSRARRTCKAEAPEIKAPDASTPIIDRLRADLLERTSSIETRAPPMVGLPQVTMPIFDTPAAAPAKVALTEAGYLILLSLAGGATHGYRIMQMINDVFRTDLRIGPGTLYRTLQRLAADGLIEEVEAAGDEDGDPERRRAYRMTRRGLEATRDEMRRLEVLVRLAKAQLPGAPAGPPA